MCAQNVLIIHHDKRTGVTEVFGDPIEEHCPMCGQRAIVELPPSLKAAQPDGTTHVCHPGIRGCNYGFKRRSAVTVDPPRRKRTTNRQWRKL